MTLSTRILAGLLVVCSGMIGEAAEKTTKRSPLTLTLSAQVAPAPAQVTARISVEPDARSRNLIVEWWNDEGAGGSHSASLDGDRAALRQDFAMKQIEEGNYVVRVLVLRDDGSTLKKETRLLVVGERGLRY